MKKPSFPVGRTNWLVLALSVLALVLSLSHPTTAKEPADPTGHMQLIIDASKDLFLSTAEAMKQAEEADWNEAQVARVRDLLVLVKLLSGEANIHFHE